MTGNSRDRAPPSAGTGNTRNRRETVDSVVPSLDWIVWYKEKEQWIDDFLENERSSNLDEIPVAEPSPDVVLPLLQHQKEWLSWALNQEASETRGGILADEMGMGKTIEAIALVLTARRQSSNIGSSSSSSSSSFPRTRCTLVICPYVSMSHWKGEIEKCTKKGSVRVFMYYGRRRERIEHNFNDYDFIITTYSIVQSEFHNHHIFQARKNEQHTSMADKSNSAEDAEDKGEQDVGDSPEKRSILHSVRWERIILDEAHVIKDSKCKTAQAVFALESLNKWALTAHPFQCKLEELYSLVRFLQIYPFSYFFCGQCNCKVLEHGSTKFCSACRHSTLKHFRWWNKNIAKPIRSSDSHRGRRAMILLKERLLKNILLRRTKEGRAADLAIPPKTVYLKRNSLDKTENEIYQAVKNRSSINFGKYATAGSVMDNEPSYHPYLGLPLVLDHPYLIPISRDAALNQNSGCESWILCWIGNEAFQTSTKIDALKEEIRNMLEFDGSAKGIVCSQFTQFLELIYHSLEDSGVKCVKLIGNIPLAERDKAVKSFTEDGDFKIILMSLKTGGVALNLTVASHVFMMDPWWNPAVELQAHDQTHRIGQYKPVRIVRFIIEGSVEEDMLKDQEEMELVFRWILGNSRDATMEELAHLNLNILFC